MFATKGSATSIDYVNNKLLACVEVLWSLSYAVSTYFRLSDHHQGHKEVDIYRDIQALCLDIEVTTIHMFHESCHVPLPITRRKARKVKKGTTTGVRDILEEGREALLEKGLFKKWKCRTGEMEEGEAGVAADEPVMGSAFKNPNGTLNFNTALDTEFSVECAFANVEISNGFDGE